MKLVLRLVASIATVLTLSASADSPLATLKNARIGMTLQNVRSLPAKSGFDGDKFRCGFLDRWARCTYADEFATVAQIPAEIFFYFAGQQSPPELSPSQRRMLSSEEIADHEQKVEAIYGAYRLAVIRVEISRSHHSELFDAYRLKVGAPTNSGSETYKNAFGTTFTGSRYKWAAADLTAWLWERCATINKSCLVIESDKLSALLRSIITPSARQRQKDL